MMFISVFFCNFTTYIGRKCVVGYLEGELNKG